MKGKYGEIMAIKVYQSTHIYKGALVAITTSHGYAVACSDATGTVFMGVAIKEANNATGSSGDIWVLVRRHGLYTFACTGADITWQGKTVYCVDDTTVALAATTTYDIIVGQVIRFVSATQVWVDILPRYATPDMGDLAAHVADTSSAHTAHGVDYVDGVGRSAAGFTTAVQLEHVLDEIYAHLMTTLGQVNVPLGSLTREDGTALTTYATGGATPGFQQLSNKEVVLAWDGNATFTKVAVNFQMPADLDGGADLVVWWDACMAGATDTPVIEHECYFGKGDTDCAGTDDEIDAGVTLTRYSATIASANVPDTVAAGSNLTVIFSPKNGEASTDEIYIYGMGLTYQKKLLAEA